MSLHDQICLTDLDAIRLRSMARQLIGARGDPRLQGEALFDLLDAADIVPANAITPDVVTMNSTVVYDDADDGRSDTVTLVYPDKADVTRGRVSVLSPLGRRLIGVRAGERVSFETPGNGLRSVRVREVVYQPEAAGDWIL